MKQILPYISKNYQSLVYLVNHEEVAKVSVGNNFKAINKNGEEVSHRMGVVKPMS